MGFVFRASGNNLVVVVVVVVIVVESWESGSDDRRNKSVAACSKISSSSSLRPYRSIKACASVGRRAWEDVSRRGSRLLLLLLERLSISST